MKNVLLALMLFAALFIPVACTTTSSGGGLEVIENLSEERFDQVARYLKIGVSFGVGQLLDRDIVKASDRWVLETVSTTLRDVADGPASQSVGNLLTDALGRVEEIQEYAKAEYIIAVLAVAENFILDRGGFGVVQQSDGTWALSDRTKALLLALADGIDEALAANQVSEDELSPGALRSLRGPAPTPEDNANSAFMRARFPVYGVSTTN